MKSFGILRTNPGLTTNIKLMVDSKYGLNLDSIDSTPELSASKYKKVGFNSGSLYDDLIPYFFNGLPAETAFAIKFDDDVSSISYNFANQYDEIYQYGARNIVNNKSYTEEYEYFAPLYIQKGNLPKYFIIFRVDGPGIINMNRLIFKDQLVHQFKTVKLFDMTRKTALGQWLDLNINDNVFFPDTPLEMNYDSLEFSVWKGINFENGGYVEKSQFLDEVLEEEKEVFEMERFIFDGYKNNKVVFPNILNFSFLYDDTPADENRLKKWSMNRYYGFYLEDIDLITTISPYLPPQLVDNVKVTSGNILESLYGDPFEKGFRTDIPMYVEYNGEYYKVEKFTETLAASVGTTLSNSKTQTTTKGGSVVVGTGNLTNLNDPVSKDYKKDEKVEKVVDRWRIISEIDLSGKEAMLNRNYGIINSSKLIVDSNGQPINIPDFDRSDLWLIEINGNYHNLVSSDDGIIVNTDYAFDFSDNSYSYFVNKNDPQYTTVISTLIDFNTPPKKFNIFRLKMSDIKDFDTRIVETEPSKFEYELSDRLTKTEESKLYFTDLNSTTLPKRLDVFNYRDQVVNIPVSSEYTANQETFKINGVELSPIWHKNPVYCRWMYQGSLSANDYPYTLNNSRVFEKFNRTTNPYDGIPNRSERNLDYFYTINSSSNKYVHHTLHVERSTYDSVDKNFDFDFEKYLGSKTLIDKDGTSTLLDFDYFNHFFTLKSSFVNNTVLKNTKKYSEFLAGDSETPNYTLFRGIKFAMYDVVPDGFKLNSAGQISNINTELNNTFENYKFSVLLTSADNGMRWDIIEKWLPYKDYKKDDIVIFDDILYIATSNTSYQSNYVMKTGTINYVSTTSNFFDKIPPTPFTLLAYDNSTLKSTPALLKNTLEFDNKEGNHWIFYGQQVIDSVNKVFAGGLFWNPLRAIALSNSSSPLPYKINDVVYRHGCYFYLKNEQGTVDFWNPAVALNITPNALKEQRFGYLKETFVYHKGKFYKSKSNGNMRFPEDQEYWELTEDQYTNFKWAKVELWKSNVQYGPVYTLVIYNDVLYRKTLATDQIPAGTLPDRSPLWTRMYSFDADTDFVYKPNSNQYIQHNDDIYRIISNPNAKTLENGVCVYINHRYKNVLVNIFVNDNTLLNLRDSDRDALYNRGSSKLVAKNFIDHINGISRKNGFSDYLKYVVVSATGSVSTYGFGNNLVDMKHILFAYGPEEFGTKFDSLIYNSVNEVRLKPKMTLQAGKINGLSQLNYFNNTHIATEIFRNEDTAQPYIPGAMNTLYRFGGNYMPLFYEIELFNKDNSIDTNRIDLMLEISDTQNVTFEFEKDGVATYSVYEIYPGVSYSNADGYWQQISSIMNEKFPSIDFSYELQPKPKRNTETEYVSFNENSYNLANDTWFDSGKSGAYAIPVPSNRMPKLVKTNLYPGDNFEIKGTTGILSFMRTNAISLPGLKLTYEFVVKADNVTNYNAFMGNNHTVFGFQNRRVFAKFKHEKGSGAQTYPEEVGVYSKDILQDNTWYHIVFKFDITSLYSGLTKNFKTEMSVFIDGVDRTEDLTLSVPTTVRYNNYRILQNAKPYNLNGIYAIGTYKDFPTQIGPFTENFSGNVASIRIHNALLTEKQIMDNFVSEHRPFSIKYRANEGELKVNLYPEYPRLTIDVVDIFDPLYPFISVQMYAAGGNPPYKFSFDGGAYSDQEIYINVPKNGSYPVSVIDALGFTASTGYYTVNSVTETQYPIINGRLNY